MKNIALIFALMLGMTTLYTASAQDKKPSKEQVKKWKEKRDDMSVESFKDMVENYEVLKGETEGLKRQIANMSRTVSDDDAEVKRLQAEVDTLRLTSGQSLPKDDNEKDASYKAEYEKGLIFKIQVGAYKKIDLSQYKGNNKNFTVEEEENGALRYILGYFRDLEEAKNFRNYIRKVGVKDAFVVGYKDGTRLPLEEQDKFNN